MKITCISIVIFTLGNIALAQEEEQSPTDSIPKEIQKQIFIYSTAMNFNDPIIARMALYNLIAENPTNPSLRDSLALSYYNYNFFASAALASQQTLEIAPDDAFALHIAANSFDNLGVKDKAVSHYENLYLINNNLDILYRIAFLQYELERYAEAQGSCDLIIANEKSKELKIQFPTTQKGIFQEVPLHVATHRIKAMIIESKGNSDEAIQKYLEVLNMYPGFETVQQQIKELKNKKD